MTGKPALRSLTLIGLGLFLTCLALGGGGGGGAALSSLFVDISQRKFAQQLTTKAVAQIWKKLYKK